MRASPGRALHSVNIRVKTQQNKTNRRAFFSYVLKQENDLVKMKRKISLPIKGAGVLKHTE